MAMTLNSEEQTRVNNVYNEREKALAENNSMYEGLINQAGQMRDQQNAYLAQQEAIQNENLDKQLAYQQGIINQQKEEAAQNKRVEENKALNDYTAYTNPYGIQNERLYGAGLGKSGVSETSKLGAYTTYQNRVATGAAAYTKAIQNYDNTMNQAILNNDVQKAQNALNKLKLELQNNQDYYSNVASLSENKLKNQQNITNSYLDQYNTVYSQILKEQAQAEAARQWQQEYNLAKQKAASTGSSGGGKSSTKLSSGSLSSGNGNLSNQVGSDTELYQWNDPLLKGYKDADKDLNWYNNNFNKHSYKEKDLIWVLDNAVKQGKLSAQGADYIYSSYGTSVKKN